MLLHKGFSILWLFSGVQLSDSLILRVLSVIAFSYYYYYYCMDLHIHNNAIAGDWVTKKSPQISSKPFSILADSSDAVICKFENLSRILNFSRLVSVVIGCVPSALIIIGMTLNLIHLFCSQTSSWYFPNFSASFFFYLHPVGIIFFHTAHTVVVSPGWYVRPGIHRSRVNLFLKYLLG